MLTGYFLVIMKEVLLLNKLLLQHFIVFLDQDDLKKRTM